MTSNRRLMTQRVLVASLLVAFIGLLVFAMFALAKRREVKRVADTASAERLAIPPIVLGRIAPDGHKVRLGQGYNPLTGEFRGFAVEPSGLLPTPGDKGSHIRYSLRSASNFYELSDAIAASASMSFSTLGGGASASMDYARSVFTHSDSVYIVVRVEVRNASQGLDRYVLEHGKAGADPYSDAKRLSPTKFFNKYGDRFVSGLVTGGTYSAVVEIHNDSMTDKQDTKAHVEASMGSFSAAGDMTASISKAVGTKSTTVTVLKDGGTRSIDIANLTNEASSFAETVKPGADPVILECELTPYSAVTDWPSESLAPDVAPAYSALADLKSQQVRLASMTEVFDFAEESPQLFSRASTKQIDDGKSAISAAQREILVAAGDILTKPIEAPKVRTNYLAKIPEVPTMQNPDFLPVKLTVLPHSQVTPLVSQSENLTGLPGQWIENIAVAFPQKTFGLSLDGEATFFTVHGRVNPGSVHSVVSEGVSVGNPVPPTPNDFYVLRSLSLSLKGPRAHFYDVIYTAKISDGQGVSSARNGEALQATGPDFKYVPGQMISAFNFTQNLDAPVSYIEQVSVVLRRRPTQ